MAARIDPVHQQVLLARIADICRRGEGLSEPDPWERVRSKLSEAAEHLGLLKAEQLDYSRDRFLERLLGGELSPEDLDRFKSVLDRYLSPGDYADAAIHLDLNELRDPRRRGPALELLRSLKAASLPDSSRGRALVEELSRRLGLDVLERVLSRGPLTERRRRLILRRLRRQLAEYCSVLHFPASPEDTFSPFLLPRVEALLAACRRLLDR